MSLILYGSSSWTSPFVLAAFVTLRAKGLSFEVKTLALDRGEHRSSSFAVQSLTSRVPVLVDGDFALSESSAIVEYLEEAFPSPEHPRVLPGDRHARARARQVMAWLRSDLLALREERTTARVFYPPDQLEPLAPLSSNGEKAAQKLIAAAESLVPSRRGHLFGEWSVTDTDLALALQRLVKSDYPVPERIRSYANEQWEGPAVREFREKPRPQIRRA
jgi:glutathione S-transferase